MILNNKIAIVTGASRGIGAASAKLLAAQGATVVINYHSSEDKAKEVLQSIQAAGGKGMIAKADVTQKAEVDHMVSEVLSAYGTIDILVCNANMHFPLKPFMAMEWEEFEPKLNNEMKASYHICRAVIPTLMKKGAGSIVLVSSGLSCSPGQGFIAHCCAKAALNAFSRSLAQELGPHNIIVNVVSPGLTETDATAHIPVQAKEATCSQTPLERIGQPEDIAGAVLFYCSEWARFITGSYLPVNGGAQMQ